MPISSSRNWLTVAGAHTDYDGPHRSGAKSVPVCSVETPGASKQVTQRTSVTPSPVASGHGSTARADRGPDEKRLQEKAKLPLITRIQNSLFGRSRSHASPVDKPQSSPIQPRTPHRRRLRQHKHHKPASPEFALRKIRFFSSPPVPSPLTVCFTYPGVDLTHRDVIEAVRSLHAVDVDDVESVQFVDMNVILGAAGVNNRWLIKVKDYDTRYLLICDGLKIRGEYVIMRKYDDVNMEDYKEYLRRKDTLASDEHRDAVQRLLAL